MHFLMNLKLKEKQFIITIRNTLFGIKYNPITVFEQIGTINPFLLFYGWMGVIWFADWSKWNDNIYNDANPKLLSDLKSKLELLKLQYKDTGSIEQMKLMTDTVIKRAQRTFKRT